MKYFYCIILLVLYYFYPCASQTNPEINKLRIEDAIENTAEDLNESGQNEIPEELQNLTDNPLDLNGNNLEILHRFNLISRQQLDALMNYRRKMGDLVEPEELQQVEGFDKKTIITIIPYCTVRKEKIEQASHRFTLRMQRVKNNNSDYFPGSDLKVLFRYQATMKRSIKFSFTGEKDAGEEFFSRRTKGFDFNSFHVYYSGNRMVRKIILGDYNLEYGQGLTAWTGLNFGGGANITSLYKSGRGIIPYTGTDENRFFRGLAISLRKGNITADTWFSYHGIDGNVVSDSLSEESYISSFQTSGYHRSYSEISDFHSQLETAAGININYSLKKILTGITFSFQHYALPVGQNVNPYAKNKFSGNNNLNAGWNFSYTYRNILFFGECAIDRNFSPAFLSGLVMSVDPRLSLGILWRSYSTTYVSLKSNAFGVNSENANEQGTFLGLNYKILRTLTYSGYTDIFTFPFLKYRVDKPSHGFDFFNQLEFTPTKKFTGQFRYRKRLKQQNDQTTFAGLTPLSDLTFDNFRFSARFKIDNTWEYGCKAEISIGKNNSGNTGKGTMISQDLFYHPMGKPYSVNFRYAIFNCPEFDTRIYSYENDVQGAFSVPFYYGSGNRFYINLNAKIHRGISVSLRYAISWIDDNTSTTDKPELKIQIKSVF